MIEIMRASFAGGMLQTNLGGGRKTVNVLAAWGTDPSCNAIKSYTKPAMGECLEASR